jgi:hypothetical protein
MGTETDGFTPEDDPVAERLSGALEDVGAEEAKPLGYWACIAFAGHNEYTGYVTEIVKNGQPAYRVDLPEKLWGGNPLSCVEYAASAWFSERPVTEAGVRRQWEAAVRAAEERKRREDEWDRLQRSHGELTAGGGLEVTDEHDYDERPF